MSTVPDSEMRMGKHILKQFLIQAWARFLYHTGAWRLINRLTPRRLLILAGHCVDDSQVNAGLPSHLRIEPGHLEFLLGGLGRRFALNHVTGGLAVLSDSRGPRGTVALSMDDGYRDNLTALPRILEATGAGCTVYLESRVLTEGRTNWGHEFFWLLGEGKDSPESFAQAWLAVDGTSSAGLQFKDLLSEGAANEYSVKKILKYHSQPEQRDSFVRERFESRGGDGPSLCKRIHLDAEGVREMLGCSVGQGAIEVGGHTRTHEVLSSLSAEDQTKEIGGAANELEQLFPGVAGETFAYPYGRDWDFNQDSRAAVRAAGYKVALTTMPGVVTCDSDMYCLPRIMIDNSTPLHMLVAHASGGFLLWKRFGLKA